MIKQIKLEKRMLDQILISTKGFAFCRIGVMIIVWIAFILKIKELVLLSFVILLLSAILSIKYAPMIIIWDYTFGKLFKKSSEVVSIKAMRFAHILGSALAGICIVLLYSGIERAGWIFVGFFAIMKTISAAGFCPASKLYTCINNGGCCSFSKNLANKK